MRRSFALLFILAATGCFSPVYHNGNTRCTQSMQCPSGWHCAVDATCWKNGQDPPVIMGTVRPAPVWISAGGGSLQGSDTNLNLSVSGSFATGTMSTAAQSPSTITLGYFASDTF
jgi:hypothetical protein